MARGSLSPHWGGASLSGFEREGLDMKPVDLAIDKIAKAWNARIDTAGFGGCALNAATTGRYANPAAYHIGNAAQSVAAFVLLGGDDADAMCELDDVAKIMALKTDAPSSSIASFSELRAVVATQPFFAQLSEEEKQTVHARIDACLLRVVDAYVAAREKILQISIDELKRKNKMLELIQNEPLMSAKGVSA